jgi:hypothetical protein
LTIACRDGAQGRSREQLVAQFESLLTSNQYMLAADERARDSDVGTSRPMPPGRLVSMLRQAVALQIHSGKV